MIKRTIQTKLTELNEEIYHNKTDGCCYCPDPIPLIVYDADMNEKVTGLCKICYGRIVNIPNPIGKDEGFRIPSSPRPNHIKELKGGKHKR